MACLVMAMAAVQLTAARTKIDKSSDSGIKDHLAAGTVTECEMFTTDTELAAEV